MPDRVDIPPNLGRSDVNHWRIEQSQEGVWLVFGDGKYPHDPPRPASALEVALHVENARLREDVRAWKRHQNEAKVKADRYDELIREPSTGNARQALSMWRREARDA